MLKISTILKKLLKYALLIMITIFLIILVFLGYLFAKNYEYNYLTLETNNYNLKQFKFNKNEYIFRIIGGNFEKTFYHNYKIKFKVIDSNSYDFKRGDIVIYEPVGCKFDSAGHCAYISRIVGLPGDKIVLKNRGIEINGKELRESYANYRYDTYKNDQEAKYSSTGTEIIIPENSYFLLDDDRVWAMQDSREFGPILKDNIVGVYTGIYSKSFPGFHSAGISFID